MCIRDSLSTLPILKPLIRTGLDTPKPSTWLNLAYNSVPVEKIELPFKKLEPISNKAMANAASTPTLVSFFIFT